jgi:regulator of replication initiation timing
MRRLAVLVRSDELSADSPRLPRHLASAAEQQKTAELASSSLLLASRKPVDKGTRSFHETGDATEAPSKDVKLEMELKKLDEQIVSLRRKHDRLHEKNNQTRTELDKLADKLKDFHAAKINPKETPEAKLEEMEERLAECAARYDDEHRLRMSYDQVRRTSPPRQPIAQARVEVAAAATHVLHARHVAAWRSLSGARPGRPRLADD